MLLIVDNTGLLNSWYWEELILYISKPSPKDEEFKNILNMYIEIT